jgi:hypothetical protein
MSDHRLDEYQALIAEVKRRLARMGELEGNCDHRDFEACDACTEWQAHKYWISYQSLHIAMALDKVTK